MIRNYILTALRNLKRNLAYSLITIFGFAVGLGSFIIIFLYIKSELSYDQHWKNTPNIYRISETLNMSGKDDPFALTSYPVAPSLKESIPGIETVVRFVMLGEQNIEIDEKIFVVENFFAADSDYYKIFNYHFIRGDEEQALTEAKTAIISEKQAMRLYGSTDAIGKTFKTVNNTFKVTGVFKNNDFNSHFVPEILASTPSLPEEFVSILNADWFRLVSYTYILAKPNTTLGDLESRVDRWVKETIDPWINEQELSATASFYIEPITDVHFNTSRQYDMDTNTSSKYIYIFGAIGIFILLIASINYMNLATAKSIRRAKEIGIRKISGATQSHLILQFISEAIIFSLLAMIIALVMIELVTPVFNQITGKNLSLFTQSANLNLWATWIEVFVLVILIGVFSGSFPAFVLSGFKPIHVLKGSSISMIKKNMVFTTAGVRKFLVVVQFTISMAMIISTWVVFDQLNHMRFRDLGFEKNNILVVDLPNDTSLNAEKQAFKNELQNFSGITQVSATSNLPGYTHGRLLFFVDENGSFINKTMNVFAVDDHFIDLLGLEVADGRFFSKDFAHDDTAAFVINEAAQKFLALDEPIGHRMYCGIGINGRIVGVVKNFNYASLQRPVEPLVLVYTPNLINRMAIKIQPERLSETLDFVEKKWLQIDQKHPFSYSFLDANFDLNYDRERRLLSIFSYFAILIVIISSMGLLGLASFTAEQRTKEIGIRKVLGSSENQITMELVRDFAKLILIAGLIAIPMSWILMTSWLEEFSSRISLHWYFFFFSLLLTLAIAVFTVIVQAIRAARSNPVDVLKYE